MSITPKRALWRRLLPVLVAIGLVLALMPSVTGSTSQAAPNLQGGTNLTWTVVLDRGAPTNPAVFWFTLFFPTSQVGYAVGGPDWIVDNPGPITLAKTTNGGATWTTSTVPFASSRTVRGLACKDANTCFLAGNSWPKVMLTGDGGANWTPVTDVPYNGALWSAAYTNQANVLLAGTTGHWPERPGAWMRSTNGGASFSPISAPDPDTAGVVEWDIECPSPGICYSATLGRAYYSSNDGASWVRRSVPSALSTRFYGLSCTSATTCWMVGNRQRIIYTTDSGVTWLAANVQPVVGAYPRFWDIDMIDPQHGYAVGCTNTGTENSNACQSQGSEGMIFRTDDGVNWTRIPNPAPVTADLMDIKVLSMDDIVVLEYTGKIWRGQAAPPTSVTLTSLGAGSQSSRLPLRAQTGIPVAVAALALSVAYMLSRKH